MAKTPPPDASTLPRHGQPFTTDEDIQVLACVGGWDELARDLGRTLPACRARRDKLIREAAPAFACTGLPDRAKHRRCLRCLKMFPSAHAGNRICEGCGDSEQTPTASEPMQPPTLFGGVLIAAGSAYGAAPRHFARAA